MVTSSTAPPRVMNVQASASLQIISTKVLLVMHKESRQLHHHRFGAIAIQAIIFHGNSSATGSRHRPARMWASHTIAVSKGALANLNRSGVAYSLHKTGDILVKGDHASQQP